MEMGLSQNNYGTTSEITVINTKKHKVCEILADFVLFLSFWVAGAGNVNSFGVLLPSRLTSDRCLFSRWKVQTGFLYCIRAISS